MSISTVLRLNCQNCWVLIQLNRIDGSINDAEGKIVDLVERTSRLETKIEHLASKEDIAEIKKDLASLPTQLVYGLLKNLGLIATFVTAGILIWNTFFN